MRALHSLRQSLGKSETAPKVCVSKTADGETGPVVAAQSQSGGWSTYWYRHRTIALFLYVTFYSSVAFRRHLRHLAVGRGSDRISPLPASEAAVSPSIWLGRMMLANDFLQHSLKFRRIRLTHEQQKNIYGLSKLNAFWYFFFFIFFQELNSSWILRFRPGADWSEF